MPRNRTKEVLLVKSLEGNSGEDMTMEEPAELHYTDKKVSAEENNKRRFKTKSQVEILDKVYCECKYPTEEIKSQLSEKLGLTEKQISGWFCHRRLKDKRSLKDEAYANGWQDHSSGVIQDHGSGFAQDSCGSTKQGDRRLVDPREVESRRLYSQNSPSADLTYEFRSHHTGNIGPVDDTSSGSSSALQERDYSESMHKFDMQNSRFVAAHGMIAPANVSYSKNIGYKPSGFLKVRGEIENAAITAVKKQLGRSYQEDGPPLGVEFQPLPPGAFESPDELLCVEDPAFSHSPVIHQVQSSSCLNTGRQVYSSKISSMKSYEEVPKFSDVNMSDDCYYEEVPNMSSVNKSDDYQYHPHKRLKQSYTFPSCNDRVSGAKSSLDEENPARDIYANKGGKKHKLRSKQTANWMGSDLASPEFYPSSMEELLPYDYGNASPKSAQINENWKAKQPNLVDCRSEPFIPKGGGPSRRVLKKNRHVGREVAEEYVDPVREKTYPVKELTIAKRVRTQSPEQDYAAKATLGLPPWRNRGKGYAAEMQPGLCEDEGAQDTSSSLD